MNARTIGRAAMSLALVFVCLGIGTPEAGAVPHHLIICGNGGQADYEARFAEWGSRLYHVLTTVMGIPEQNVRLFTEVIEGTGLAEGASETSLEAIDAALDSMGAEIKESEDLFVYLIGHGSYIKRESRFNIPGPDLTANAFKVMLESVTSKRVIIINSTAASAAFINVLSGPNRIVCTATKSIDEINATDFMEYFIVGLEEGSADQNHDERISVLEACQQASELTATAYLSDGFIATEHAILDDNGDGLGSRLPLQLTPENDPTVPGAPKSGTGMAFDGELASTCFLMDYRFGENVPEHLIDAYLGTLERIAVLKREKKDLSETEYYGKLEELLISAARANREIRNQADNLEAKAPSIQ